MRNTRRCLYVLSVVMLLPHLAALAKRPREILVSEYLDKMKAGWIGQMAGVGWGAPTEFACQGKIMPESMVVPWTPDMINQFGQDDLYVEMTFLNTLERHGLNADIRLAGIDFAASGYGLAHANDAGRNNLRRGIAPPDSGHPQFNVHADDIDYQIEADFSGLIAPGMPQVAIRLGEVFGRLMNYGDGLYGGQFMGGMYSEAFFEDDVRKIVEAGLRCIPSESQYAECIQDVLRWHRENPEDWEETWQLIENTYQKDPSYRRSSCDKGGFNIDAKINGAYVVMGLLYGDRDPDKTITIANRCGQDSDCNPSSAAGVLFTTLGFSKLPDKFVSALDENKRFSHTAYSFPELVRVCETLARQAVIEAGGTVRVDGRGTEKFIIPQRKPVPSPLERSWAFGPVANSRFSREEMEWITKIQLLNIEDEKASAEAYKAFEAFAPGWRMVNCGDDMAPGLYPELIGKKNVFLTHPLNQGVPCVLVRDALIPTGKRTTLHLVVGHHQDGDWDLMVRVDDNEAMRKPVGKETAPEGWTEAQVDLSCFAGKTVRLEIVNQPTGWAWEAGYWAEISLRSE